MKAIGEPRDRVDGRLKVTGAARYAAEVPVAGVAHAVMVSSTIGRGKITGWDVARAKAEPGVLAVFTSQGAPKVNGGAGFGGTDRELSVLQDDEVHYSNQPIALVVADTFERAKRGAELVVATYASEAAFAELSPPAGPGGAVDAAHARALDAGKGPDESFGFKGNVQEEVAGAQGSRGDLARGLAQAEVRVSATYTTPAEAHNPMEPHATIAAWQGENELVLYDSTQGVFEVRRKLAHAFDLKVENVRVISHFVGGGFGSKGSVWSHVVLAALAARSLGRPVKLAVDRGQMFGAVGFRPQTKQVITLGAKRDGTLTAIEHHAFSACSRFDTFVERMGAPVKALYACPNVKTTQKLIRLDIGTPTFMRAPGESTGSFALESAMDELSYALGLDPLALRLKNHADIDPDKEQPWSSKSLRQCYQRGAEAFGWSKRAARPRATREGNALIGLGMATATYPSHASSASALARLLDDGTALVQSGSQDIGTGTYTVMTQVAADALGLPFEKVRFELGDTSMPETPTSGGSMTTASVGNAVQAACLALREKLLATAREDASSPLHGAAEGDVALENGRVMVKSAPERSEPFEALLRRKGQRAMEEKSPSKERAPNEHGKGHSSRAFGAHFVEVRVDLDLGTVRVSRVVSAFASGRILNAKTARSQYLGGVVWGIGMALHEEMHFDPRTARVMNNDLAEYHVPVNADLPDVDVIMVEEDDPFFGALGAKGIGEIGICGTAAAIANAVYHATGKRVRDLPIRVDKLL